MRLEAVKFEVANQLLGTPVMQRWCMLAHCTLSEQMTTVFFYCILQYTVLLYF